MSFSSEKLGDIIVEKRLFKKEKVKEFKIKAEKKEQTLYEYLLVKDKIGREDLGEVIAEYYGVKFIKLKNKEIDQKVVESIPAILARKDNAIVFDKENATLKVAMFEPDNEEFIENVKNKIKEKNQKKKDLKEKAEQETKESLVNKNKSELISYAKQEYNIILDKENTKKKMIDKFMSELEEIKDQQIEEDLEIEVYFSHKDEIQQAIAENYKSSKEDFSQMVDGIVQQMGKDTEPEDVPIIKIVEGLLDYAYKNKASDIHIEPYENKTLIRFRIDGILHDILSIPKSLHNLIITRIKILARLRTDEHRAAQDGKLRFNHEGEDVDVRVSIVPIVYGEKAVLRLLAETTGQFTLDNLGLSDENLETIKDNIKSPWGMILATGPTGSGKTTTLYTILKRLNTREVNISTIEDPVEYGIESINQIQVNEETNLTFSNGLRSIVRQDPDIIMVGEIRDEETASIAVNAAMTGHLVLSTLHTNDSATTLPRLLDMGIKPFLVASTLNVVIAQRLVREICQHCKKEKKLDKEEKDLIKKEFSEKIIDNYNLLDATLYEGVGCPSCQATGYQGRVGVY
ncbi:MAG: hypothetical protein BRC22_03255, partial [Parcubacteria group bacterium QH_9_35_7]